MKQVESSSKLDNSLRLAYRSMSVLRTIFRGFFESSNTGVRNRLRTFRFESLEKREVFSNSDLVGFDARAQSKAEQPDHFFVRLSDNRTMSESRDRTTADDRSPREQRKEQTQRIAEASTIFIFSRHFRFEPSELIAEGELSPISFDVVFKTIVPVVDMSLARTSASSGVVAKPRDNNNSRDNSPLIEPALSTVKPGSSTGAAGLIRDDGTQPLLQYELNEGATSQADWTNSLKGQNLVNRFDLESDDLIDSRSTLLTEQVSAPNISRGRESAETIDSVFAIDNKFFVRDLFHPSISEHENSEGVSKLVIQLPLKQTGKVMERERICDPHQEDWRELPDGMVYFEEGERGFGLVSYEQNMDTFRMARLTHNTSSTWVGGSGLGLLQWFATYVDEERVSEDWSEVIADQMTGHFVSVESESINSGSESELMLVLLIGGALGGSRGFYMVLREKSVSNVITQRSGHSQAKLWPWRRPR